MSLLFHTDNEGSAILHPEIVKLCPSLAALSEKEVLFIVLYTDYNSIYKQYPDNDRKRRAMFHAFGDNEVELVNSQRIQDAIADYNSLQYSSKLETAKIYQQKIDKYQQQLLVDDNPLSGKKIGDAIDDLTRRIETLKGDYDKEMRNNGVIKGKMDLSRLEKVMANRNHWLAIINKK
jgi:hypothetical protein